MALLNGFTTIDNDPYYPYVFYTLRDIVEGYGFDLGMRDYPIFDEAYRDILNRKIQEHFWFREFSARTPQQFIFFLNRKLNEQMPQINRLYEALRDEDPFFVISETTGSSSSTGTETSKSKGDARQVFSDTPQVQLIGGHDDYATTLTGNKTSADADASRTGLSNYVTKTKTQAGTLVAAAEIWIDGINNADLIVFDRLEPLFVQVWNDRIN